MNKKHGRAIIILFVIFLFAPICYAQNALTKTDVLDLYGKPFWTNSYENIEVWYYPKTRQFIFLNEGIVYRIDTLKGEMTEV